MLLWASCVRPVTAVTSLLNISTGGGQSSGGKEALDAERMSWSCIMRILITSWPAYGHLYPMLTIARAAQRAGHDVLIATNPEMAVHVEQRGFVTWPVGPSHTETEAVTHFVPSDRARSHWRTRFGRLWRGSSFRGQRSEPSSCYPARRTGNPTS